MTSSSHGPFLVDSLQCANRFPKIPSAVNPTEASDAFNHRPIQEGDSEKTVRATSKVSLHDGSLPTWSEVFSTGSPLLFILPILHL